MVRRNEEADSLLSDHFGFQLSDRTEIYDASEDDFAIRDDFDRCFKGAGVHDEFDILLVSDKIADRSAKNIFRQHALSTQCEPRPFQARSVWREVLSEKISLL